jgi:hypothetical protein
MVIIILNTIVLGLEWYGQSPLWHKVHALANLIFTVAFTIEMLLKIIGLGFFCYLTDGFNQCDFTVVTVGLFEYVMEDKKTLSVLRGFRILRIMKLFKRTPNLQLLVKTLLKAV